jgi:hypothetical protein
MTPEPLPSDRPAAVVAEPRGVPAELQYAIIVLVLVGLLLISGGPGAPERQVGDGTSTLRKGWAADWTAEVQAREAAGTQPAQPALPAAR